MSEPEIGRGPEPYRRIAELEAELAAERERREHETNRANENHASLTRHWLREGKLQVALEFFANEDNWRRDGKLDPNSGNFIGMIHARAALNEQLEPD